MNHWFYRQRDPLALTSSLALLLGATLLWKLSPGLSQALQEPATETVVRLDDALPEPPPPEPRPQPPLPTPQAQPTPATAPQPRLAPMPESAHPDATPVAPPPPPTTPPAPPTPAPLPPPPAATPAPPPPVDTGAQARQASAQYVGQLRAYLNSIKRYPNSREARQLRPTGVVKAWLDLDRGGQLLDAGVETSSGTALLDNEALRTLRNGRYPAFPAEAFGGEARHRFVVPLEYLVDGG